MADRGLTGVLLVGGASARFGSPKALALLDGETLAERAWRVLGETCDERLAVGKTADGLELPFPLLDDGIDVRAALAGIVAGLRAAAHDVVVVLPVDVPYMTPAALRQLAGACLDARSPRKGRCPAPSEDGAAGARARAGRGQAEAPRPARRARHGGHRA